MILKKMFVPGLLAAAIFAQRALAVPTADDLFSQVKAKAQQEHKHVLMVFSASWCGPCKLYERFLEAPEMQPITEKAFVVQRIDVGEKPGDTQHANTPGGEALRSALGATKEPGFPFLVMTDADGKPLVNSYIEGDTSKNIGYPAAPEEIDWYIEMLKRAAPSLSNEELAATHKWLKAHSPF